MEIEQSKVFFNSLLEGVLNWLVAHRSYGVEVTEEEYLEWEGKLTLATFIIQNILSEREKSN